MKPATAREIQASCLAISIEGETVSQMLIEISNVVNMQNNCQGVIFMFGLRSPGYACRSRPYAVFSI